MKKIKMGVVALFLAFISIFILASCGKKLPQTKYEKVKFAFNGVEKSFKSASSSKKSSKAFISNEDNVLLLADTDDALSTIENIYTPGDNQGDAIDELSYNEPPMIQFQYLKSILEKTGKDFEFGTKYYYDITDSMYADFITGEKKSESDEYKYDYSFVLGVEINIDDNDLIKADISFDITLTKGSERISVLWYVGFELDYDMKNQTPSYKLDLITDEDELNHPLRNCYVVENDYVEVKDNKIEEWRKFCFETDQKLVKDSAHQTFDDYINDGITYNVSTCKWYKNGSLRKITQMTDEKKQIIANAYYNYGLTTTDVNSKPFMDKQGKENDKIKDCYNAFSNTFGDDIIYDIILNEDDSDDDDHGHGDDFNTATGIKVMYEGTYDFGSNNILVKNVKVKDIFNDASVWLKNDLSKNINATVYYVNKDNVILQEVDPNDLEYYAIYNNTETMMNKEDYIGDLYASYGSPSNFSIRISVNNLETSLDQIVFDISSSGGDIDISVIETLGFPPFKSQNELEITKEDDYTYNICNYDYDEFNSYKETLTAWGYIIINSDGNWYGRIDNNNKLLVVREFYNNNKDYIQFKVDENNPFEEWNLTEVDTMLNNAFQLPQPNGSNVYYRFSREKDIQNEVYPFVDVYGMTETELNNYIDLIKQYGAYIETSGDSILRIIDNQNNKFYEIHFGVLDHNILNIRLYCHEIPMKKMEYKVNSGDYNQFTANASDYDYKYEAKDVVLKANDIITINAINFELDFSSYYSTDGFTINSDKTITVNQYGIFDIVFIQDRDNNNLYVALYYVESLDKHQYKLYVGKNLSYTGGHINGKITQDTYLNINSDYTGYETSNSVEIVEGDMLILVDEKEKTIPNLMFNGFGVNPTEPGCGVATTTKYITAFIAFSNPTSIEVSVSGVREFKLYVGSNLSYEDREISGVISSSYDFSVNSDYTGYTCNKISLTQGQELMLIDEDSDIVFPGNFTGYGIEATGRGFATVTETCTLNFYLVFNNPDKIQVTKNE